MPSWLAGDLALTRGSGGSPAYPDIGAGGGKLAGLPVLTYEGDNESDGGPIALIDGAFVGYAESGATLHTSQNALIEQRTDPSAATDTPTAAGTYMTSMFQSNATALLATIRLGWLRRRTGAVQVITAVSL